jgi:hypothetical protein
MLWLEPTKRRQKAAQPAHLNFQHHQPKYLNSLETTIKFLRNSNFNGFWFSFMLTSVFSKSVTDFSQVSGDAMQLLACEQHFIQNHEYLCPFII